jgi:hypothetical protein
MTRYLKDRYVQLAIAIVAVVALVATNVVLGEVRSDRDRQKVATMTEKMKTVCVGRFLIDFPEQTEYTLQGAFLDGFDIRVFPETDEAFKARLADRETELRNPEPTPYRETKQLETSTYIQVSDFSGKRFVFGRRSTYGFEGDKRIDFTSVEIEVHAHASGFGVTISNSQADPDRLDWPLRLLAQISLNPENKIPNEPGFCIDHAYFREPLTADQGERVTMLAGIPAHPDLTILFDMTAGAPPAKEGLLARTKRADASGVSGVKKLTAGPRAIDGIPGEQSLEGFHERNSTTGYAFIWDSPGTKDDVFRPALYFEVQAGVNPRAGGEPVQSSLSQKALLDLWDKISSSIRVRPTESPKVSAVEPVLPIGTYAWAGDTVPETGWWQCSAGGNGVGVMGGQRQYLKRGERMPQALLLPPQTLWEKVRGLQPSYETRTPTSWKLVDRRTRERVAQGVSLAQAVIVTPAATTTAAASGPSVVEQLASVGTFATTATPCPASGWWQCEEPHALDGTRWFAQGSLLPTATFTVSPNVFGKSASGHKTIRRSGTWRLVRYAQAPAAADDPNPTAGPDSSQAT